jgi:hypothetical protein
MTMFQRAANPASHYRTGCLSMGYRSKIDLYHTEGSWSRNLDNSASWATTWYRSLSWFLQKSHSEKDL